jgi:hypothetical protein
MGLKVRRVTDVNMKTRLDMLCKKMKAATKDERGWFEPLTRFFKDNPK